MAQGGSRRPRVPGEQRIFSLVLALVASPQGLGKHELLASVHGYADRYRPGVSDPALERQFERDKDQARALGIPIETIDAPAAPGDNRLTRYRIAKESLQLPAEVRFTAREITLLRLAARAWSEGSLGAEARRSAMKLEAMGAGLDARHLGIAPSLGSADPAVPRLRHAIEDGREVRFDYLLPGRERPLARRVVPLRLHRAEGRWHLIAHDVERGAERVFLLSRIVGEVRSGTGRAERVPTARADAVVAELAALTARQRVTVTVAPGSVAEARLLRRAEQTGGSRTADGAVEFGTLDSRELAIELAGYGDEVVVRTPDASRAQVLVLLRTVREQHAEAGGAEVDHG